VGSYFRHCGHVIVMCSCFRLHAGHPAVSHACWVQQTLTEVKAWWFVTVSNCWETCRWHTPNISEWRSCWRLRCRSPSCPSITSPSDYIISLWDKWDIPASPRDCPVQRPHHSPRCCEVNCGTIVRKERCQRQLLSLSFCLCCCLSVPPYPPVSLLYFNISAEFSQRQHLCGLCGCLPQLGSRL